MTGHLAVSHSNLWFIKIFMVYFWFGRSVLWHCWLCKRKGIQPVKNSAWAIPGVIFWETSPNQSHLQKQKLKVIIIW